MRQVSSLIALVALLAACSGEKKKAPPKSSDQRDAAPATAQKPAASDAAVGNSVGKEAVPTPARRSVRVALGDTGLFVFARLPVQSPTTSDDKLLFLHLGDERGLVQHRAPDGKQKIGWRKTMSSLRFSIDRVPQASDPGSKTSATPAKLRLETVKAQGPTLELQDSMTATLSLDGTSIKGRLHRNRVSAQLKRGRFPNEPGNYKIQLSGVIDLDGQAIPFVLPALNAEYKKPGPKNQTLKSLEKQAKAHLQKELGAKVSLQREKLLIPVDTESGWRVFAFKSPVHKGPGWLYWRNLVVVTQDGALVRIDRQRVNTCVGHGVIIDTPAGPKTVEKIRRGDLVWGFNESTQDRVPVVVEGTIEHASTSTITLGPGLHLSPTHPVLTPGGYRWAQDVQTARSARGWQRVRPTPGPTIPVYDISVSWPHTFIAGGVVVHNKSGAYVPAMFDAWRLNPERHDEAPKADPNEIGLP